MLLRRSLESVEDLIFRLLPELLSFFPEGNKLSSSKRVYSWNFSSLPYELLLVPRLGILTLSLRSALKLTTLAGVLVSLFRIGVAQ